MVERPKRAAGGRRWAFLGACLLAAACGRPPEPPAGAPARGVTAPTTAVPPLPPEMRKIQDELDKKADQTKLEIAQDARDRVELVTPAPPGFKPKVQGRKLELKLIAQKTMLRKGEPFWYRAQVRNVGSDPITISDSFIKSGFDYYGAKFKIMVNPRDWKDHSVLRGGVPCEAPGLPIPGWDKMDEAQRRVAAKRYVLEETVLKGRVHIVLQPGETLRTQDERHVSSEEDCTAFQRGESIFDRPGGLFREYFERRDFDRPGTYTVKLVLSDPLRKLTAEARADLQRDGFSDADITGYEMRAMGTHLGNAESEAIRVEVVR